ncbi:MAG: polyribonucleotide nucleotidyltransferase [Candidatus Rokubacteria bacterium 13_1_40CM_4_69_39]|nr:MAG: polyribonucleotide nucleotidyltransferase [Candidatus Rokubacteria bacterium 13_1_40CM_69_96]OLC55706.1 MAG: polyribonucleotide nucleotidyltransferase [Candidatus Rokubacteria bacterium 13_1_40CM_4_69_39]OLC98088.1 MAG: polyribonucleotide nucleotidyltransferase [Candidatus Rokubacteria bacterium 13_1_40CM_3_69_38]OLD24860.1 MAG: polyribonucleotide nucleotidyltransferase [Candidatus Rokubacteria bacterium 13_1_40CM_2_70_45]
MSHTVQTEINGGPFSIETGKVAKQADGAVVVRYGGTMVLATCVTAKTAKEAQDFFPLTVEYRERMYAGGRIPGGYFRREGAPSKKETLTCRLIDRPIRPLFPDGFRNEVQVICLAISADAQNDPDILAMNGASTALTLSGIPFNGPVGAVRVGLVAGQLVANPTKDQQAVSSLDLVIAGTEEAVLMVESGASEVPEETMLEAIAFGHAECRRLARLQVDLAARAGKPRWPFDPNAGRDPELEARVRTLTVPKLAAALATPEKHARAEAVSHVFDEVWGALALDESKRGQARAAFEAIEAAEVRRLIVERGIRVDGRKVNEVRPITIEMAYLPRAHGSTIFTRGETQALVSATLGTKSDEQKIETLEGETWRHFMLHYNFPSFSVGEVRRFGGPSRRDIGHGALAERAVEAMLPAKEDFPYTIRIVSDILESNGSSSMATVCGASLALMDAGVPIKTHVAGIAMGLVKEGDKVGILTDIMGSEDHYGDMDFKVAGTEKGITALQMDIKTAGVSLEIMREALRQAREARMIVLAKMREAIEKPRPELSPYAPRFVTIKIRQEKIREIIGPGGKVVRGIQEQTGTKIDIEDDGRVTVFSSDQASVQKAIAMIQDICREVELDRIYLGKVKKIVEFGAFVEVIPNTEGLLHISQIAESRIRSVQDVLTEGDEVLVKVIEIDGNGKMRLSRKMALRDQPALADKEKLKNPQAANPPRA